MLEECANVVNDRSFSPNDSPEWAPYYQGAFSRLRSTADGASRHQAETTNRRLLLAAKCSTGLAQWWPGWNGLRSCRHEL
jgi:hypothetical protein